MENSSPSPGSGSAETGEIANEVPLERFLKATGWGLYSKFIVGIICFVNFAQGVTFSAVPWALALSTCDQLFIPKNVALKIFTSLFIGKVLGEIFIGMFMDRYGRKKYLTYTLIFIFMSTFIAAFAYNALILVGAALFLGIGLETNNTILRLLLAEILPQEKRGFYLSMCSMSWSVGYLVTAGSTILFETRTFLDHDHTEPRLAPWRVMFVACGGINIFIACACALLEESPRHYLYLGKSYLGFLILKQLYAINTSMHADSFKVKETDIKNCIKPYKFAYREPDTTVVIWYKLIWRLKEALRMIFSKRFVKLTWVLIMIKIPVTAASAFHLNVLFAKQTARMDFKTTDRIYSKNFFDLTSNKVNNFDFIYPVLHASETRENNITEDLSTCSSTEENKVFHTQFLMLAVGLIFGAFLCMATIDNFGRKWLILSGLLLASLTSISLAFVEQNFYSYTIITALLIMVNSVLWIAVSIVTVESYPTAIRGTVQAVTSILGLLIQIVFINFIYMDVKIFCLTLGVTYFWTLKERKGKQTTE